jgi:hypothetical protein
LFQGGIDSPAQNFSYRAYSSLTPQRLTVRIGRFQRQYTNHFAPDSALNFANRCRVRAPPINRRRCAAFLFGEYQMPGLNHVRKEGAVNVISTGVSKTTLDRLNAHCAKHDVSRSLVIRDFIEFCLALAEGGEVVDEIKAKMKG